MSATEDAELALAAEEAEADIASGPDDFIILPRTEVSLLAK